MHSELYEVRKSIKDITIREQLKSIEVIYSKIIKLTNGNVQEYPNIKQLKTYYVPILAKLSKEYAALQSDEQSEASTVQFKLRDELNEFLFWANKACVNVLDNIREEKRLNLSVELETIQHEMRVSGITGSDFVLDDIFKVSYKEELDEETAKLDPFAETIDQDTDRSMHILKEGYKLEYDLRYKYIEDYYSNFKFGGNNISLIIADLYANKNKAKLEVAKMLQPILKDAIVCIAPDIGYRSLIDSVKSIAPEYNVKLAQVVEIDIEDKIYFFNREVDIKDEEMVLLSITCSTGKTIDKCRRILYENGASNVKCIVLGREMDIMPM